MKDLRKDTLITGGLIISLLLLLVSPLQAAPSLATKYYCLVDGETLQPILYKNAAVSRQVASTTKMMTAILTVEYAGLQEQATVSKKADQTPEFTIGLRAGQNLTVGELLKAALIRSSNDAAVVLAEHIAGDEEVFAWLMTKKAFAIGAVNTSFQNASGLPDQEHYSTAYDLACIGRYAMAKDEIRSIVGKQQMAFKHPGYQEPMILNNTNPLLKSYPGANGIKTGTADAAGKCLVGSASRQNRKLISVVLKSANRTGDCAALFEYGFNQCQHIKILDHREVIKSIRLSGAEKNYVDLVPVRDIWVWQGDDNLNIEKRMNINYELKAPIKKGQSIGSLDIFIDGCFYDTVVLKSVEDIDRKPGLIGKSLRLLLHFWEK